MKIVPQELRRWMKEWPGLSLFLPKLNQSLNFFYNHARRYHGLLQTVRELERFTSHTTTTSVIWRQYIACGRDIQTFTGNFIEPMCFLMTHAEKEIFCSQFQIYMDCCIKRDIQKRLFGDASPLPEISKEIHELFDFEPIDALNTKPTFSSVDLCDKDTLRGLFEKDLVYSQDTNSTNTNALPSLSIADEDSLESWPDIAATTQDDLSCPELSPLDW